MTKPRPTGVGPYSKETLEALRRDNWFFVLDLETHQVQAIYDDMSFKESLEECTRLHEIDGRVYTVFDRLEYYELLKMEPPENVLSRTVSVI